VNGDKNWQARLTGFVIFPMFYGLKQAQFLPINPLQPMV